MSTKKKILEILEYNKGHYISGEVMADDLRVSRNSIWKGMKELEKEGYQIEAVTGRGYRLCESNDILSEQGIRPFLSDKEYENRIHIYKSLASTNKTAKEMAIAGAKHGTIILAEGQTDGKGRYNRSFFSPDRQGIYISFILRPSGSNGNDLSTLITAYAAVSVCQAIESTTGKSPRIKWVNDLFLEGKKICGILTEAVTDFESGRMQWVVLGIGINFVASKNSFPEEIKETAGAIFYDQPATITRNRLVAEIINGIMAFNHQSKSSVSKRGADSGLNLLNSVGVQARETILAAYRKRLMMLGQEVVVTGFTGSFVATALDIDENGRLLVRKENGDIEALTAGEVGLWASKNDEKSIDF